MPGQTLLNHAYLDQLAKDPTLPEPLRNKILSLQNWVATANNPGAILYQNEPKQASKKISTDKYLIAFGKSFIKKTASYTGSVTDAMRVYIDFMKDLILKEAADAVQSMGGQSKGPDATAGNVETKQTTDMNKIVGEAPKSEDPSKQHTIVFNKAKTSLTLPTIPKQTLTSPGDIIAKQYQNMII